jgi:hypothetical protein
MIRYLVIHILVNRKVESYLFGVGSHLVEGFIGIRIHNNEFHTFIEVPVDCVPPKVEGVGNGAPRRKEHHHGYVPFQGFVTERMTAHILDDEVGYRCTWTKLLSKNGLACHSQDHYC